MRSTTLRSIAELLASYPSSSEQSRVLGTALRIMDTTSRHRESEKILPELSAALRELLATEWDSRKRQNVLRAIRIAKQIASGLQR